MEQNRQHSVTIDEPTILIRIAKEYKPDMTPRQLYDATRGIWRVGERRERVELAMAVYQGVVKEVYVIEEWYPAGTTKTTKHLDLTKSNVEGRWEFEGHVAPDHVRNKYLDRSVEKYIPAHAQNPIKYVNVEP